MMLAMLLVVPIVYLILGAAVIFCIFYVTNETFYSDDEVAWAIVVWPLVLVLWSVQFSGTMFRNALDAAIQKKRDRGSKKS